MTFDLKKVAATGLLTAGLVVVYWQTLTNVVGEGTVITITDSLHAEPQRFYRVKTQ